MYYFVTEKYIGYQTRICSLWSSQPVERFDGRKIQKKRTVFQLDLHNIEYIRIICLPLAFIFVLLKTVLCVSVVYVSRVSAKLFNNRDSIFNYIRLKLFNRVRLHINTYVYRVFRLTVVETMKRLSRNQSYQKIVLTKVAWYRGALGGINNFFVKYVFL